MSDTLSPLARQVFRWLDRTANARQGQAVPTLTVLSVALLTAKYLNVRSKLAVVVRDGDPDVLGPELLTWLATAERAARRAIASLLRIPAEAVPLPGPDLPGRAAEAGPFAVDPAPAAAAGTVRELMIAAMLAGLAARPRPEAGLSWRDRVSLMLMARGLAPLTDEELSRLLPSALALADSGGAARTPSH
jgi:hypothetical protein